MKVTSKGQVTIPLHIRKKLQIDETTEVEFTEENGKVYLVKSKTSEKPKSSLRVLRGVASVKLSTEEILALTR